MCLACSSSIGPAILITASLHLYDRGNCSTWISDGDSARKAALQFLLTCNNPLQWTFMVWMFSTMKCNDGWEEEQEEEEGILSPYPAGQCFCATSFKQLLLSPLRRANTQPEIWLWKGMSIQWYNLLVREKLRPPPLPSCIWLLNGKLASRSCIVHVFSGNPNLLPKMKL